MPLWLRFWMKLTCRIIWSILKAVLLSVWRVPRMLFSSNRKTPDLSADVCLVTGAGQGLGRQLALQLAECGATLVLWDIDGEKVRAVAGEIREGGREAYPYVVDCSKKEDVYRVAEQVRDEVGDVAVLVNNAGVLYLKNYASGELSDEEILKTFAVNILAHFWTVRAFLPWMLEKDYGYIVNIASGGAITGVPNMADYCATKASVRSFSESLRYELLRKGKKGITVIPVSPVIINTPMTANCFSIEEAKKRMPILNTETVTRDILNAMVEKKFHLPVPWYGCFLPVVKSMVPQDAFDLLMQDAVDFLEHLMKKKKKD